MSKGLCIQGRSFKTSFRWKGGSLWKSGPLYAYVWKMRFFFAIGWWVSCMPYVATKCTANKKKNHPEKSFDTRYRQTFFSQWNSGKRGHQNKFSRLSSTRALLVDFASSRSRAIEPVALSSWKSKTGVKTKRQNHLRHANRPKKKRNKNRSPKITSSGNLKFRSCFQPS